MRFGGVAYPTLSPEKIRANTESRASMYFRVRNVDPEVMDRVLQLTTEAYTEDAALNAEGAKTGINRDEVRAQRDVAFDKYKQELSGILGQEEADYFVSLYLSASFVPLAQTFAEQCAAQGTPLAPKDVAAIAIDLRKYLSNPEYPLADITTPDGVPMNEAMAMSEAKKVLTPAQLELFKKYWSTHPYPKLDPGKPPSSSK